MQQALSHGDESPMVEINTTPLIDVLLVLLIMFIITIPLQSHAVKFELSRGAPYKDVDPHKNKIVITAAGAVLWNASPVSLSDLRQNLEVTAQMLPAPELHLQPQPEARYELVDQVLAVTKRTGVTNVGFVGNEQYANY
jgi:biopolymer transport protein ExbD